MKGLRQILRVSWTAKQKNDWVLGESWFTRKLLATVKARKMKYVGHIIHTYIHAYIHT